MVTKNSEFLKTIREYNQYTESIYKVLKSNSRMDSLIFRKGEYWYKFENWEIPHSGTIREWKALSDDWMPKKGFNSKFNIDNSNLVFKFSYAEKYLKGKKIKNVNLSNDTSYIMVFVENNSQYDIYLFEKTVEISQVALITDISIEGSTYCDKNGIVFCRHDLLGRPKSVYYKDFLSGKESLLLTEELKSRRLAVVTSKTNNYFFVKSSNYATSDVHVYSSKKITDKALFSFSTNFPRKYEILSFQRNEFLVFIDNNDKNILRIKDLGSERECNINMEKIDKINSINCFGKYILISYIRNLNYVYLPIEVDVDINKFNIHKKRQFSFNYKTELYENSYSSDIAFFVQNQNAFVSELLSYNFENGEIKVSFEMPNSIHSESNTRYHHKVVSCVGKNSGINVPVTLFWKGSKTEVSPFKRPCVVYAYGAYGKKEYYAMSSEILAIINEGFVYAIVHVRGGGFLGGDWYRCGKGLNKWNSINDLLESINFLCDKNIIDIKHLGFTTSSAGGILAGTVLNIKKNLFNSMLLYSPYVNPLDSLLDKSDPLSETEKVEWGDVTDEITKEYILSYSPMQNVKKAKGSKATIINIIGTRDFYINNMHIIEWSNALNYYGVKSLLYENFNAGHGGFERGEELLMSQTINYFLEKILEKEK